jgi:hypothetical protein
VTDFNEINFVLMGFYVGMQIAIRFEKNAADLLVARELSREVAIF